MVPAVLAVIGLGVMGGAALLFLMKDKVVVTPGTWYRLTLTTQGPQSAASILKTAGDMGRTNQSAPIPASGAALDTSWTVIARATANVKPDVSGAHLVKAEPVDAPPSATVTRMPSTTDLDANLSPTEKAAVVRALTVEKSPTYLIAFANAMRGDFPKATSALAQKAISL